MNVLQQIKSRFAGPLAQRAPDPAPLLAMIRPAQDPRFGDYQANCAMPLGKRLGQPPRDIAAALLAEAHLDDLCQRSEVAGPGFINLMLSDDWLAEQLTAALQDDRLGVAPAGEPHTYVIDFSSPNVAKPMHVGHIRSTVIGNALARILRFLGQRVITDNHLGDWGTQFGMIFYGYRHFLDETAYRQDAIAELGRLYRYVRRLMDLQDAQRDLPRAEQRLSELRAERAAGGDQPPEDRPARKARARLDDRVAQQEQRVLRLQETIEAAQSDDDLRRASEQHPDINAAVLGETARLHAGDPDNVALWNEFLPACRQDMQAIYDRLGVTFDFELGESFYQPMLADVVSDFQSRGLATESQGAVCVFLENYDAPMIIQKSDGAFLYATSDLATIDHRVRQWAPDEILYVVDFRQHEHFSKLFDVARAWKYPDLRCTHVSFGTVMGEDGKPFRTRSGDTVGLSGLLDEAEQRALKVVSDLDDQKPGGPELDAAERRDIATVVGLGALIYADLSQNRTTDYTFSYDKMLQLNGNTATYLQYGYARVNGIFRKGGVDVKQLRSQPVPFQFAEDVERQLAVRLLRFEETLCEVIVDYRPNLLANYLFDLAQTFFVFFEKCPVLRAETETLRRSRLQLCDLTARTIKQGLDLMGIQVVPKM